METRLLNLLALASNWALFLATSIFMSSNLVSNNFWSTGTIRENTFEKRLASIL